MRRGLLVLVGGLVLAASATGCERKSRTGSAPVAGLYALEGTGVVVRPGFSRRSARPGQTLTGNAVLTLEGRAVLEGFNGRMVALGEGEHRIGALGVLKAPALETRLVYLVGQTVETQELSVPVLQSRYEPLESGRPLPDSEDSLAENVRMFFSPDGMEGGAEAHRPQGAPPPWLRDAYVHALRRPLVPGDGARALVEAKGAVVVEFRDRSTTFASGLALPLDLADVERIVVVEGSARLALPEGRELRLGAGEAAEVR